MLAFSGEYDGNVDVFTVPASGGVPKRVTFHPDADRVVAKLVVEGQDPQLERAVVMTLQLLEKNPPPMPKRPEFPNYQRPVKAPAGAGSGGW
jgi:hypothetical protein